MLCGQPRHHAYNYNVFWFRYFCDNAWIFQPDVFEEIINNEIYLLACSCVCTSSLCRFTIKSWVQRTTIILWHYCKNLALLPNLSKWVQLLMGCLRHQNHDENNHLLIANLDPYDKAITFYFQYDILHLREQIWNCWPQNIRHVVLTLLCISDMTSSTHFVKI